MNLSPHSQCADIKATDQTLGGFVKVLEIISKRDKNGDTPFRLYQHAHVIEDDKSYNGSGTPQKPVADWTAHEDLTCIGCIGSLLAWFFGVVDSSCDCPSVHDGPRCHFLNGINALNWHLGLKSWVDDKGHHEWEIQDVLTVIIDRIAMYEGKSDDYWMRVMRDNGPFSMYQWPVDYLPVFRELHKHYPDK